MRQQSWPKSLEINLVAIAVLIIRSERRLPKASTSPIMVSLVEVPPVFSQPPSNNPAAAAGSCLRNVDTSGRGCSFCIGSEFERCSYTGGDRYDRAASGERVASSVDCRYESSSSTGADRVLIDCIAVDSLSYLFSIYHSMQRDHASADAAGQASGKNKYVLVAYV